MPAISRAEARAGTGGAAWARIGVQGWPAAGIPSAALWLLAVALVAMPSYQVKVYLTHSITPNVLELLLLPGLILAAFAVVRGDLERVPWAFTWPALGLLVIGAAAILWSPDRRYAFGIYRTYLVEPIAVAYVLNLLLDSRRSIWLIATALVAGGVVAAVGQLGSAALLWRHHLRFDVHPPNGLYENPNMAALFLIPAICVAAALAFKGRALPPPLAGGGGPKGRRGQGSGLPRPLAWAVLALLLAGLLATYSRGGILAAAAAGVVFWLLAVQRWRWRSAAAGLLAAALVALLAPGFLLRISHVLNPTDPANTLVSRSVIWAAAAHMLRDHPITGIGLADFQIQLHRYAPTLNETHTHPHNLVLNLWLNLGILGLIVFAAVFAILIAGIVRGLRQGRDREFYLLFCAGAAAVVGILVHGLVDNVIWKNDLALQFWTLTALVTAALRWHASTAEPPPAGR